MIDARFRSIDSWPYESTPADRRKSRHTFKASWQSTLDLLDRELSYLDATDVTIECGLRPQDIRLDGWPRSGAAQPIHPGVAVHFDAEGIGHLRYGTDVYETWEANLRAIALGLQALRAVDRYGITSGREQYRGFAELPSGIAVRAVGTATMTPREAAAFLAFHAGFNEEAEDALIADASMAGYAYHRAAKKLHPDKGGSTETFQQLQEAKRVLDGVAA